MIDFSLENSLEDPEQSPEPLSDKALDDAENLLSDNYLETEYLEEDMKSTEEMQESSSSELLTAFNTLSTSIQESTFADMPIDTQLNDLGIVGFSLLLIVFFVVFSAFIKEGF